MVAKWAIKSLVPTRWWGLCKKKNEREACRKDERNPLEKTASRGRIVVSRQQKKARKNQKAGKRGGRARW